MAIDILGFVKGGALKGGIGLISLIYPPAKPLIDQIQTDIDAGKVTVENIEATINATLTFIEGFTPDQTDAVLEQAKVFIHEAIVLEQKIEAAIAKGKEV